jgi:hypothetical protein
MPPEALKIVAVKINIYYYKKLVWGEMDSPILVMIVFERLEG